MPKNYQISQYDLPLVIGGAIPVYDAYVPEGTGARLFGTIPPAS